MVCYFCTAVGVALTFLLTLAAKRVATDNREPPMARQRICLVSATTPNYQSGQTMFDIRRHSAAAFVENWPIWVVTITLVVAAVIDGLKLKVPNWITFPMIISGWIYSADVLAVSPAGKG